MAFAAVTSLLYTISRFLKSDDDVIQIVQNSSPQMIKLLQEEADSLVNVLQGLDSNTRRFSSQRLKALDAQIRDAVFKLEDVVEFHLLHQFVSQSENNIHQQHPLLISIDIEELKPVIDSLIEKVNKLKAEYIYELSSTNNNLPKLKEEEDDDVVAKSEPRMFGIVCNRLLMDLKDMMVTRYSPLALWGMAGIGKTTLARKLFQDPSISSHYESRAFVTVGPEYHLEDVYLDILKQLDSNDEEIVMLLEGDDQEKLGGLRRRFAEYLKDPKCLVVLDDLWDNELLAFDDFRYPFHGGTVLVTTRLKSVALQNMYWEVPFLDKKESWDLLCAKVFGEDELLLCPSGLKRAGKKIAENCEGLPLTIVTVADILSKQEITLEHWNNVAANTQHPVYVEAYAKMHTVLVPSYYGLPQYLRICFLYMGLFPQNYEIPCAKLRMLWTAEGFFIRQWKVSRWDHFNELKRNSVLIVRSTPTLGRHKAVGLHSSFWYVCKKEAGKSKFFHSFTTLDDCLPQGIDTQRRLCIYNPVLFAIKDAFEQMASVSAARSLLCTGVYHQYPVPIFFNMKLLRVLYALPIRFYEFPVQVLKLIHLTYFALTCDGDLPSSISKLWNLVYLIVDRCLSIKSSDGAPSYLPVEIWNMLNLEHLQVMGSDLPEPPQGSDAMLLKLDKLLDVSPHSCSKRILERFPNLTKLGIRIELSPDDDAVHQPLGCLDHMSELRSFKCVVVNPMIMFPPPIRLPIFPEGLVKLTLSGLGYPWEEMSRMSSLPKLRVLKLLSYAFRGPKWDMQEKQFSDLRVLVIEETDLVQWTSKYDFPIRMLRIKQCYKLKEIPMNLKKSESIVLEIEVVDCNPLVVSSANKLKQDLDEDSHGIGTDINVHFSWDDEN